MVSLAFPAMPSLHEGHNPSRSFQLCHQLGCASHIRQQCGSVNRRLWLGRHVSELMVVYLGGESDSTSSDIDYEYPANTEQGEAFADLLTEVRTAFTALQKKNGDKVPYQLTAAVAAGPAHYQWYNVPKMDAALDYWNLMVGVPFSRMSSLL